MSTVEVQPNLLQGFDASKPEFAYLGPGFDPSTMAAAGFAGWRTTADGKHRQAYQFFGDPKGVDNVFMVHHGGPGDSISVSHIAPLLALEGVGIFAYNQRLSGVDLSHIGMNDNRSKFLGSNQEDPFETHTPDLIVDDVESMRVELLNDAKVIHFGGSYGSIVSIYHAEKNKDAVKGIVTWGITLGLSSEVAGRYDPEGPLAEAFRPEFERFYGLIPDHVKEQQREDDLAIVSYLNKVLDMTANDYDQEKARDVMVAYGLLHFRAAQPDMFGEEFVAKPTPELYGMAELLGIKPEWYAGVSMRNFAECFPTLGDGLIDNVAELADKLLVGILPSNDVITPPNTGRRLLVAARVAGVAVHEVPVEGGFHGRNSVLMQKGLLTGAQIAVNQAA